MLTAAARSPISACRPISARYPTSSSGSISIRRRAAVIAPARSPTRALAAQTRSHSSTHCRSSLALASALGEGIGWSGFLAPRLAARYGFTKAALITGAIWASWHFPILLFSDYFGNASLPAWFALPCFVIQVLGLSVIMLWLRLRSGSLWTGALISASVNVFNGLAFAPLTAPRGWITSYTIDDSGFMLPVVIVATALLFWLRRRDVAQPRVLAPAQP